MRVSCLMCLPEWLAGLDPDPETPPATAPGTVLASCCSCGRGPCNAACLTEKTFTFWSSFIVSPKHTDFQHGSFCSFGPRQQLLTSVLLIWKWMQSSLIGSTVNICITHGATLRLGRPRGCLVSLLTLELRKLRCQINRTTCPGSHGQGSSYTPDSRALF